MCWLLPFVCCIFPYFLDVFLDRKKSWSFSCFPTGILRREWRDYGLFALKGNGFRFQKGELIIPEDGIYYLYSQVYFNHDDKEKDPNIAHFMYKKSGSVGETVLTSIVTRSEKIGVSPVLYNSFTAGQFNCRKGDRVMVGVSEELIGMVQFIESLSYFGGFLVERRTGFWFAISING